MTIALDHPWFQEEENDVAVAEPTRLKIIIAGADVDTAIAINGWLMAAFNGARGRNPALWDKHTYRGLMTTDSAGKPAIEMSVLVTLEMAKHLLSRAFAGQAGGYIACYEIVDPRTTELSPARAAVDTAGGEPRPAHVLVLRPKTSTGGLVTASTLVTSQLQ